MSCSERPTTLVFRVHSPDDLHIDVGWTIGNARRPFTPGDVRSLASPERALVHVRAELVIAYGTWTHRLGEWDRMHPPLVHG